MTSLKILILEDIAEDAELIEDMLTHAGITYQGRRVDSRIEFISAVEQFRPDVIISDHSLPQFNSTAAIQICKNYNLDVPFILVTGTVSEEFAVAALQQGADDYILKSNLSRLPSAILNSLKRKETEQIRKLDEEKLKDQNTELLKINEELDRFVYSASHDLRAPLKSVLGLVKLFQDEVEDRIFDNCKEYLSMVEKSIVKLDLTIKDIINYSKNARTDIHKEKIDLSELINGIFEDMRYLEGADRIHMHFDCITTMPFYTDCTRLVIVLNNLISNSIKYSSATDTSFVKVNAMVDLEKATISIEDNGIGIEDVYIEKIFNMFYRATSKSEGSGLGLYIVKESLKKINGSISVNSVINKGTTFTLEIPNHYTEAHEFVKN